MNGNDGTTEVFFRTFAQFQAEHARYAAAGRVVNVCVTECHWIITLSTWSPTVPGRKAA